MMLRVALALSILLLAGCGSSRPEPSAATPDATATASPTATPTPTPTHEDMVQDLNAACDRGNRRLAPIRQRAEAAGEDATLAADVYRDAVTNGQQNLRRLERIEAPPEDTDALRRYVVAVRKTVGAQVRIRDLLVEKGPAFNAQDSAPYRAALERASASRIDAALELGADRCGR